MKKKTMELRNYLATKFVHTKMTELIRLMNCQFDNEIDVGLIYTLRFTVEFIVCTHIIIQECFRFQNPLKNNVNHFSMSTRVHTIQAVGSPHTRCDTPTHLVNAYTV